MATNYGKYVTDMHPSKRRMLVCSSSYARGDLVVSMVRPRLYFFQTKPHAIAELLKISKRKHFGVAYDWVVWASKTSFWLDEAYESRASCPDWYLVNHPTQWMQQRQNVRWVETASSMALEATRAIAVGEEVVFEYERPSKQWNVKPAVLIQEHLLGAHLSFI